MNSPGYGWGRGQQGRGGGGEEFRSPRFSPQDRSPVFSPYNSSSPTKHQRGAPRRYFNSYNAGSNSTPYKHRHRNNSGGGGGGRRSGGQDPSAAPISLYYDPSALENPWADLEKLYEDKRKTEAKEPLKTSPPNLASS